MPTTETFDLPYPEGSDAPPDVPDWLQQLADAVDSALGAVGGAAVPKSLVDAKGDLLVATGADTVARLAVGANGTVLAAASGETGGVKWAATGLLAYKQHNPSTFDEWSTTSSTLADVDATNMAVTFTAPLSGKVLVRLTGHCFVNNDVRLVWGLREGSSNVAGSAGVVARQVGASSQSGRASHVCVVTGLTPGSSYTYKWSFAIGSTSGTAYIEAGGTSGDALYGPAVMEVWSAP